jgi:putative ABC transport system permease protein
MKYLPFILRHLRRNWIRTTSTVLAMSICIFLFCTLRTVIEAVNWGLKSANAQRIVARHAVSLAFNLPLSYENRIAAVPGVKNVMAEIWFMGLRGNDFKNFFPNLAVESEKFFDMYPEFQMPDEQKKAWMADQRGCIVGRKTAEKFGWKIGDTFQLESAIPPYRIGKPFEFVVRGIFDSDPVKYPGTDLTLMYFHYKYLYEARNRQLGVGIYSIKIDDPKNAAQISKQIDAMFENTDAQTHTETEAAFRAGFVAMAGNLALLLNGIALAVSFTILCVCANTMGMAVRERRTEIAILKTLGFSSALVMTLILLESLTIGALGGGLGVLFSRGAIRVLPNVPLIGDAVRQFPTFGLSAEVGMLGFSIALALGLLAGIVPAVLSYRARITEMLRAA